MPVENGVNVDTQGSRISGEVGWNTKSDNIYIALNLMYIHF